MMALAGREDRVAERPVASLLADVGRLSADLVRQEAALARAEISESLNRLSGGGAALAVGAALCGFGLLGLMASAILGLSLVLAPWLAALAVGGGVLVIGLIVTLVAWRRLSRTALMPTRTIANLRDGADWVGRQVR